jgi:hypothetical protein
VPAVAPASMGAPAPEPASTDVASPQAPSPMSADVHPSMVASIREQCSACGAAMASDQRYCVECGQRRGPARVPTLEGLGQRTQRGPAAQRPARRARMSINSTLIAGVGTLLLAMGVGVLIGRSGNNTSAKAPAAQVVTVAGAGGAGAASTGTAGTTAQSPSAGAASAAKSSGASASGSAKSTSKASSAPPPKAVKVGSTGKGPGYQHGHFTGNFFGPESE